MGWRPAATATAIATATVYGQAGCGRRKDCTGSIAGTTVWNEWRRSGAAEIYDGFSRSDCDYDIQSITALKAYQKADKCLDTHNDHRQVKKSDEKK